MKRVTMVLLVFLPVWLYFGIFCLPYFVWTFPLTQNWFTENGLVMFRDIIYHHTQLPLFILLWMSKFFGNTGEMLRISSFLLAVAFGYGIYLVGKQLGKKIGVLSLILFLISFFPLFHNFNIEEMTASLFSLYATYFFLKFWQKQNYQWLLMSGIFLALGVMGKQLMLMIIPAFAVSGLWYTHKNRETLLYFFKGIAYFVGGYLLATIPFLIYYLANNALVDFFYWNVTFNLFVYPKYTTPYAFWEGIRAGAWLLFSLIPALYLLLRRNVANHTRLALSLFLVSTVFLSSSLLPSFHAYKILPFYPYPLLVWAILLAHLKERVIKVFLIAGLFLFLPLAKSFYLDYLPTDLFNNSFILDYGNDEQAVVTWLKNHTSEKERIMNLGNHYITTMAQRLPQNKYVYLFPWLVAPFEASSKEILAAPPKYVIVDWRTFEDFPILNQWPFIEYVRNNYQLAAIYGTYEIFVKQK